MKIKPNLQFTDYYIGSNLLANLHNLTAVNSRNYSKFLLLSDTTVFKLYGDKVISSLEKLGRKTVISLIIPGEKNKTLSAVSGIVKSYLEAGFDRNACLLALGGGVITDLGGFVASILLRGIDCVHLPTTLLGQIDAAIGGKNGVDFQLSENLLIKNMVGTIQQPSVVISDVDVLSSLPQKEISNGLGEMTKYWAGWGRLTISDLVKIKDFKNISAVDLISIISMCQKIKTETVLRDPFEKLGIRHKLNLGHTVGHAIEGAANGRISHGQAVSMGLVAAAKLSVLKKLLTSTTCQMIISQLQTLGLPTKTRIVDKKKVLQALNLDKKGGTFVLLKDVGNIITGIKVEKALISKVITEVVI